MARQRAFKPHKEEIRKVRIRHCEVVRRVREPDMCALVRKRMLGRIGKLDLPSGAPRIREGGDNPDQNTSRALEYVIGSLRHCGLYKVPDHRKGLAVEDVSYRLSSRIPSNKTRVLVGQPRDNKAQKFTKFLRPVRKCLQDREHHDQLPRSEEVAPSVHPIEWHVEGTAHQGQWLIRHRARAPHPRGFPFPENCREPLLRPADCLVVSLISQAVVSSMLSSLERHHGKNPRAACPTC